MKYLKTFSQFVKENLEENNVLGEPEGTVADYKQQVKYHAEKIFSDDKENYTPEQYIEYWITNTVDYFNIPDDYYWYSTDDQFDFIENNLSKENEVESYNISGGEYGPDGFDTAYKYQVGEIEFYVISHDGGDELFIDPKYIDELQKFI